MSNSDKIEEDEYSCYSCMWVSRYKDDELVDPYCLLQINGCPTLGNKCSSFIRYTGAPTRRDE